MKASDSMRSISRIYFCDDLRGFASLLVMLAHLTIGFEALHGFLYNPVDGVVYPVWFLNLFPFFFDGALGVALFFLISGFIIPFSLNSKDCYSFIISRIIRIYPLMIFVMFFLSIISLLLSAPLYLLNIKLTCTLLMVLVFFTILYKKKVGFVTDYKFPMFCIVLVLLLLLMFMSGKIFKLIMIFINNISLFRGWTGGPSINSVLWTLEIEMRFYLYLALSWGILRKYPVIYILIPQVITVFIICLGVNIDYPVHSFFSSLHNALNIIGYDFGYITFMNIGVILYLTHTSKINLNTAITLIFASFIVSFLFLYTRYNENYYVLEIYLIAFFIFITMFVWRFNTKGVFSGFFSKISYPLYLCHSSLGYILLSVLIFKFNIYSILALCMVASFLLFISWILHIYIEKPIMLLSSQKSFSFKKQRKYQKEIQYER